MLIGFARIVFHRKPENGVFACKRETLIINTLRKHGFVSKAERAVLHCKTGTFATQNGRFRTAKAALSDSEKAETDGETGKKAVQNAVCGMKNMPFLHVGTAIGAVMRFYFGKTERRFFQNKTYMPPSVRPARLHQ